MRIYYHASKEYTIVKPDGSRATAVGHAYPDKDTDPMFVEALLRISAKSGFEEKNTLQEEIDLMKKESEKYGNDYFNELFLQRKNTNIENIETNVKDEANSKNTCMSILSKDTDSRIFSPKTHEIHQE